MGLPCNNKNRVASWQPLIDRFVNKLSTWKAKLLSISGCLTLIKVVMGSIAIYPMSIFKVPDTVIKLLQVLHARFFQGSDIGERKILWVAWNHVISYKDSYGLGISSLLSFNWALLFRWRWRYLQYPSSLWERVVNNLHGSITRGFGGSFCAGGSSPWLNMYRCFVCLKDKGINLEGYCRNQVGNGLKTQFWLDILI